jgi:hypothetical protein
MGKDNTNNFTKAKIKPLTAGRAILDEKVD